MIAYANARAGAFRGRIGLACLQYFRSLASAAEPAPVSSGGGILDHGLSQEQAEIRSLALDFALSELAPHAARWDEEKEFPVATIKKAAELGFGGLYVSEDVGGTALSRLDSSLIVEALAYGDVSVTAYLTIHNMVAYVIDKFGHSALREKYLPSLVTMQHLASYCLTEPGSGSDAASLATTAVKTDDGYVLTGSKVFISGAGASDLYLVMARTSGEGPSGVSAFVVEKGMPGVSFGKMESKLGWRSQPTGTVNLDRVHVPVGNRLGAEGEGFKIAMHALDGGRVNIAACSVGGAQFCVDYARTYTRQRSQFGRAIADFQATQFRVADMATDVQASRLMVRNAAVALDEKRPTATLDCAMAKRFATDTCYEVTNHALQLLGGYGYLQDYPIERYMRDLRVHSILEGTNEIMRHIVYRQLEKLEPTE